MIALEEIGVEAIGSVPDDFPLSKAQRRVVAACRSGGLVVQPALAEALAMAPGPCAYLDFATFSPAVPLYAGTRP